MISEIVFILVISWTYYHSGSWKEAFFLPFLRSILNTYLITLSLEKEIIVLEKGSGKTLNFRSKNLYEPCMLDFWFIAIHSIFIFNLRMYFLMVCSYRKNKCQARSLSCWRDSFAGTVPCGVSLRRAVNETVRRLIK